MKSAIRLGRTTIRREPVPERIIKILDISFGENPNILSNTRKGEILKLHQFLTKDNWVNHAGDRESTFCLIQALGYLYKKSTIPLIRAELGLPDHLSIVAWNDDPERTFEQVQAVLLKLDI